MRKENPRFGKKRSNRSNERREGVGSENGKCRKVGNATAVEEHGCGSKGIEVNFGLGKIWI